MKKVFILSVLSLLVTAFTLQASQFNNSGKTTIIEKVPIYNNQEGAVSNPVYIETVVDEFLPAKVIKKSAASLSKTVNIAAGGLLSSLNSTELKSTTNLTIKGTIDARDFKIMRDSMTSLSDIDISEATILQYTGTKGTADTITTQYPANTVPKYAFGSKNYLYKNTALHSISLPNTATVIDDYAFQYCTGLTIVNIGLSVVSIGNSSFYSCTSLTSLYIPASVTSIGEAAFLGDNCQINVDGANTAFSSINGVLFDKYQTTLIKVPSNITGTYVIPSTVAAIGNLAFFGCNYLTEVTIPSTVTKLGNQAFSYVRGMYNIFIPSSVTTLGSYVFLSSSCYITVDENNPQFSSGEGVLFNKTKTILIQCPTCITGIYNIPSSVMSLNYMVFQNCNNLTTINIPSSISNIPYSAFNGCTGLTSLMIPATVTSIGGQALYNCSKLSSLYALSPTPVNFGMSGYVFYNVNKTSCTLYVPMGSKLSYQAAAQWKDFSNIVEITTGVLPLSQSHIKVINKDKTLVISNAESGSKISVYTVAGVKIKEQSVENDQTEIALAAGVYVLRIGDYSDKVIIK
jgi:hypothetical protein